MSEIKLKPCPFCGGKVVKFKGPYLSLIMFRCNKCGATVSFRNAENKERQAINAFNTRAITPDIVDKISQELQNAGFTDASKWFDCKYEL